MREVLYLLFKLVLFVVYGFAALGASITCLAVAALVGAITLRMMAVTSGALMFVPFLIGAPIVLGLVLAAWTLPIEAYRRMKR